VENRRLLLQSFVGKGQYAMRSQGLAREREGGGNVAHLLLHDEGDCNPWSVVGVRVVSGDVGEQVVLQPTATVQPTPLRAQQPCVRVRVRRV
jgi:hypothetical protein